MNERILMLALVVGMSAALSVGIWPDFEQALLAQTDVAVEQAAEASRHAGDTDTIDAMDVHVISALGTEAASPDASD